MLQSIGYSSIDLQTHLFFKLTMQWNSFCRKCHFFVFSAITYFLQVLWFQEQILYDNLKFTLTQELADWGVGLLN